MKSNNLEQKVDQALSSLDGMQRATANPFLYTRVKAMLDEQNSGWGKAARLISRPVLALSLCALFVTVNLWVAINNHTANPVTKTSAEADQALAAEYNTVTYSMMDFNSTDK